MYIYIYIYVISINTIIIITFILLPIVIVIILMIVSALGKLRLLAEPLAVVINRLSTFSKRINSKSSNS